MLKMFAVYDSKACSFLNPITLSTTGLAIRQFETAANAADHHFNRHAADYTLFEIGTFDEEKGIMQADTHINLGTALTYITTTEEN